MNLTLSRNPYYTDAEVKCAAQAVYDADSWADVESECDILMRAAGVDWSDVAAKYDDRDGTLFECVMDRVAEYLGVDLY